MKGKYMENPDYIINCYKKGKLVKDIEIQMDEKIFKHQIKEGILNYFDVNSGEVEMFNLNQFDYYEIKDLRIREKYDKLQERINKAIEYIKERTFDEVSIAPFVDDFNCKENLLNILQGSDKDE